MLRCSSSLACTPKRVSPPILAYEGPVEEVAVVGDVDGGLDLEGKEYGKSAVCVLKGKLWRLGGTGFNCLPASSRPVADHHIAP